MSSERAENAIMPFVLLGKKSKGKAAASLITEAVKNPNTFLFGELLEIPGIQQLDKSENQKEYDLLCLFAYGTYNDYKKRKDDFPIVQQNEKALAYKLKQLTVVTLASKQRTLSYNLLLQELDIDNVRELEDLLIDCMYQDLIRGKLDQKSKFLEVYETIGRDIKTTDIDSMVNVLKKWTDSSDQILKALQQNTERALSVFEVHRQQTQDFNDRVDELTKTIKASLEISDMDPHGMEDDFGKRKGRKPR